MQSKSPVLVGGITSRLAKQLDIDMKDFTSSTPSSPVNRSAQLKGHKIPSPKYSDETPQLRSSTRLSDKKEAVAGVKVEATDETTKSTAKVKRTRSDVATDLPPGSNKRRLNHRLNANTEMDAAFGLHAPPSLISPESNEPLADPTASNASSGSLPRSIKITMNNYYSTALISPISPVSATTQPTPKLVLRLPAVSNKSLTEAPFRNAAIQTKKRRASPKSKKQAVKKGTKKISQKPEQRRSTRASVRPEKYAHSDSPVIRSKQKVTDADIWKVIETVKNIQSAERPETTRLVTWGDKEQTEEETEEETEDETVDSYANTQINELEYRSFKRKRSNHSSRSHSGNVKSQRTSNHSILDFSLLST